MNQAEQFLKTQKERYIKLYRNAYNTRDLIAGSHCGLLFHGTNVPNLKTIEPRESKLLNDKPAVFAGTAWAAVSFTARWGDDDIRQGTINGEPYMTAQHSKAWDVFKDGGWVYALAPHSFRWDPRLTYFEYISDLPCTPVWSVFIEDPVSLLRTLGVVLKG